VDEPQLAVAQQPEPQDEWSSAEVFQHAMFTGTVTGRMAARDPLFQHPYGENRRGWTVHEVPWAVPAEQALGRIYRREQRPPAEVRNFPIQSFAAFTAEMAEKTSALGVSPEFLRGE